MKMQVTDLRAEPQPQPSLWETSLPRMAFTRGTFFLGLMLSICALPSFGFARVPQAAGPPPLPPPPASAGSQPATANAAAVPSRFRITGTVVNSVTKAPVPRAELAVSRMASRRANARSANRTQGQNLTAVSDAAGRFEIEVPSAGGWSLSASAHGYHTQAFDEHEGYSTAIVLTDAEPAFELTFLLPPSSAIEGYVVDEAGEPVRDARLTVSFVPPPVPEDAHPKPQVRGTERTDDRGYFKLSGLLAGSYQLRLQAQPWYATTAGGQRFERLGGIGGTAGSAGPDGGPAQPDPLDVVYPTLWYPGVADISAAAAIALRPGEVREADFRLSPMPGFHLRVPAQTAPATDSRRPAAQNNAYLTQIMPDGSEAGVPAGARMDAQGNADFSGLAPGTYIVHRMGEGASGLAAATVQISPNSARTVDITQATSDTVVTVKIDAAADLPSLQIVFRNVDSNRTTFVQSQRNGRLAQSPVLRRASPAAAGFASAPGDAPSPDRPSDRTVNLQPGRYDVSLSGINELHLSSIEATGATATGRRVTIAGGAPSLMLHVASGRASVLGVVRLHGAPAAGAMVLLVPATLDDPSGLDVTRRDQSNSDGSFDILNVLPGAYILVAIDHGWDVNWRDPATLRRFLMHGTPLDLTTPGERKETIEAQLP